MPYAKQLGVFADMVQKAWEALSRTQSVSQANQGIGVAV